jgi:hypothetical protein
VKKVMLVLGALVIMVCGVAMVSAYEAHVVNVTAKVENALNVTTDPLDYGTVFPEEWLTKKFKVQHSISFCEFEQGGRRLAGTAVDAIDYEVWVVRKKVRPGTTPYPDPVEDIGGEDYYYWLGDALYMELFEEEIDLNTDPRLYPEGASGHGAAGVLKRVTTGAPSATPLLTDTITKPAYGAPDDTFAWIVIGLDVPVFAGSHNQLTDVPLKPSGLDGPTVELRREKRAGYRARCGYRNPGDQSLQMDGTVDLTRHGLPASPRGGHGKRAGTKKEIGKQI